MSQAQAIRSANCIVGIVDRRTRHHPFGDLIVRDGESTLGWQLDCRGMAASSPHSGCSRLAWSAGLKSLNVVLTIMGKGQRTGKE